MTNYLRFADEPTFRSAAFIAGLFNEPEGDNPGGYIQYTHDHAMDIVGTIYNDDATFDPETREVVTPATPMLPTGWDAFLVSPVAPYRVFA
jgi:aryl-phospho-beta-D-glucosidase BglC (GH1 family)